MMELKRDALHCMLKHLSNARIHIEEAWTAVKNPEHREALRKIHREITRSILEIGKTYTGEEGNVDFDRIVFLRRALMSLAKDIVREQGFHSSLWDELMYAVGHLDNASPEHVMELEPPHGASGSPQQGSREPAQY